jgi:filamin
VEVTFGDVPVAGSPFKCEVVDPRKVFLKGADEPLTVRHAANITVNRKQAGRGELSFEVTDPQGTPLTVEHAKAAGGDDTFTFLPTKPGGHRLTIKFDGFVVPGTPKTLIVEEQGKPSVYGAAVDYAVERNQQASLIFDPKKTRGDLKVSVRGADGEKVRHATDQRPDGTTEISFRSANVGKYLVNVEFNNKAVFGSPFEVRVVDPNKVIIDDENVDDEGVLHLTVARRNVLDVDATAAGPGKLRTEVRDSDGELVREVAQVENLGYGKYRVVLHPHRVGTNKIYLYWAELVVPSAYPLHAIVEPSDAAGDAVFTKETHTRDAIAGARDSSPSRSAELIAEYAKRVTLRGDGLSQATIKQPSDFVIDATEAPAGNITAKLIGDKADIPVRLTSIGNNVFKGVYTPLVGGNYELQVHYEDRHVHGSPSKVHIQSYNSTAELIKVDAHTLKLGIIGEEVKTVIDARKAGAGHLSAQCMGPSQLEYCELFDNRDGTYILSVTPKEIGKHTLSIKYANEHVPGSPFVFTVSHPPDATKVKVFGPGVEHGILHSFKSNFVVETKGAGAGQLTVRVRGPKGAFNVEMQRDKHQDRTIHCKYEPREPGDYQVEVKWHGQHVPGSPFLVMIVDTEQELQRFLAGQAPSPQPATPFIPPGWVGPPPGPPLAPSPYGPIPIPPPGAAVPPHFRRITGPSPSPVPIYSGVTRRRY